jgi:hypothetical protein
MFWRSTSRSELAGVSHLAAVRFHLQVRAKHGGPYPVPNRGLTAFSVGAVLVLNAVRPRFGKMTKAPASRTALLAERPGTHPSAAAAAGGNWRAAAAAAECTEAQPSGGGSNIFGGDSAGLTGPPLAAVKFLLKRSDGRRLEQEIALGRKEILRHNVAPRAERENPGETREPRQSGARTSPDVGRQVSAGQSFYRRRSDARGPGPGVNVRHLSSISARGRALSNCPARDGAEPRPRDALLFCLTSAPHFLAV